MALVQSEEATRNRLGLGYLACATAGCLWSTGFFFGKIALVEMSVGHMVLYRFLFACVGFLPVVATQRPGLTSAEWRLLLLASFLGVPVQFLLQFWGLSMTTVSHACLMVGTLPVILAVGATVFTHERLDRVGWMALGGSSMGVALIVLGAANQSRSGGKGPSLAGDLLVVLSMITSLGWILINKKLVQKHPPVVVTAYGIFSGMLMLVPWVLLKNGMPPLRGVSPRAWLALVASGVLCTATTTLLWNWGIHHVPASRAGVFLNIEPALGSAFGVKLMGDRLGPSVWIGGALILAAAITLTSRRQPVGAEVILE